MRRSYFLKNHYHPSKPIPRSLIYCSLNRLLFWFCFFDLKQAVQKYSSVAVASPILTTGSQKFTRWA